MRFCPILIGSSGQNIGWKLLRHPIFHRYLKIVQLILGLINNTPTAASKCGSQQAAPGMAVGIVMVSPPH
jgi:hypothetical protein